MPHYTMKGSARLLMGAALIAISTAPLQGQAPAARGLEIATEADRRDTGFGDSTAELLMTLRNSAGQESIREIRNKTLEMEDTAIGRSSSSISHGMWPARRF